MPKIETEWQRFEAPAADRLYERVRFRQAIFVFEQCSAYPDLDGLDRQALHLLLRAEGALRAVCAYCRRHCGSARSRSLLRCGGTGSGAD